MDGHEAVFSVTQLNALIKERIASDHRLAQCSVMGEISNFKWHSSGHLYFTLKDEQSRIRAVMFAGRTRGLKFRPEDGMRVIAAGQVNVFERDGQYQLYVDNMQPDGIGALYVAFTQLKNKLEREGLFEQRRKRPLPTYPVRVGVVTSPTGSVIRDICTTLRRRYPLAKVLLHPARVQGPGAAETIVQGIRALADWSAGKDKVDVIIVARGGGSLEELWPFNEEIVARAIAACEVPVVSAVGHETDFTISDFVADIRAATPTAAAELVAPSAAELVSRLDALQRASSIALTLRVKQSRDVLQRLRTSSVLAQPTRIVDVERQNVDFLESKLQRALVRPLRDASNQVGRLAERLYRIDIGSRLVRARARLDAHDAGLESLVRNKVGKASAALDTAIAMLEALNPLGVLKRGYSVVYAADGERIVNSVATAGQERTLFLRLMDGTLPVRPIHAESGEEASQDVRTEQSRLNI